MPGIENVNFSLRNVLAVAFRFAGIERQIILAPDDQQTRLLLAHPCLPLRVGVHVGSIVVKQIALNVGLAGLIEEIKFVGAEIGGITFLVGVVSQMARSSGSQRQEICAQRAFVGRAIGPKSSPRFPVCTQAFVVRYGVLNN